MIKQLAQRLLSLQKIKGKPFKPIIVSDIDGVLVRGNIAIPETYEAMLKIHQRKIPFACLTNGGGQLQSLKTKKMNMIFNQQLFKSEYMFMNHTPLKPELIKYSQKPGNLLLSGSLHVKQILDDLNIKNYITADEFYAIYMHQNDIINIKKVSNKEYQIHQRQNIYSKDKAKREVQNRMGRNISDFRDEISEINSIFALNDVSPYQTTLQVLHNLLSIRKALNLPKIHYFAAQNDIIWAGGYKRPRMAFGPFNYILEDHCAKHEFQMIEHIYYGKPQTKAFSFVQKEMRKIEPDGVFFMMGDNPRADIRGANNIGWYSFLTRTGIHSSEKNDERDPATFVVNNFGEAISIICTAADIAKSSN